MAAIKSNDPLAMLSRARGRILGGNDVDGSSLALGDANDQDEFRVKWSCLSVSWYCDLRWVVESRGKRNQATLPSLTIT
jgi:hypothetical protein